MWETFLAWNLHMRFSSRALVGLVSPFCPFSSPLGSADEVWAHTQVVMPSFASLLLTRKGPFLLPQKHRFNLKLGERGRKNNVSKYKAAVLLNKNHIFFLSYGTRGSHTQFGSWWGWALGGWETVTEMLAHMVSYLFIFFWDSWHILEPQWNVRNPSER